jgi:hypothetical protein
MHCRGIICPDIGDRFRIFQTISLLGQLDTRGDSTARSTPTMATGRTNMGCNHQIRYYQVCPRRRIQQIKHSNSSCRSNGSCVSTSFPLPLLGEEEFVPEDSASTFNRLSSSSSVISPVLLELRPSLNKNCGASVGALFSLSEESVVELTLTGLARRPLVVRDRIGFVSSLSELSNITSSSLIRFLCPSSRDSLPRFRERAALLREPRTITTRYRYRSASKGNSSSSIRLVNPCAPEKHYHQSCPCHKLKQTACIHT